MCPYDPLNFHLSCNDLIMFFARFGYYTLICSCAYMAYTVDLQWYVQMSCTSTWLEWVPVHVIFINPCDLFVPLTNRIQFHVEAEFLTKYYMGAWKTKIEWIYWNNLVAYMTTFLLWKLLYTIFKKKSTLNPYDFYQIPSEQNTITSCCFTVSFEFSNGIHW